MINFKRVARWLKDHLPEILTVSAVGCVVTGDYLLWKATKKETEDGNKKHYILPLGISGAGIACIIASNRVSNYQKVSLAASVATLAAKNMKQRQALEGKLSEEDMAKLDEIDKCALGKPSGKDLIWMPDFGIKFYASKEELDRAEIRANKFFDGDGYEDLEDILEALNAIPVKAAKEDRNIYRNIIWSFDWDSDEEQGLIFERMPVNYMGVDCIRLKIKQFGGRFNTFQ